MERIKKTFSISEDTARRIERIGTLTNRADSHVIDWLVAEAWNRIEDDHKDERTIESETVAHLE
jgi:hypothetical protein